MKPSKEIRPGDVLEVTRGQERLTLTVRGTARRRGPASEAALLYDETAESRQAREQAAAQRRLEADVDRGGPRPTKRDRRRMDVRRGR